MFETIGWAGSLSIIGAFMLVSYEIIEPRSITFQLMNFTGATAVATISFYKNAYQPAVLNAVFGLVAVIILLQILI